jgi:hypothetical protein
MSKANSFIFSQENFNRIFPFYILIDQGMVVTSVGTTLEKMFAATTGKKFFQHYCIKQQELNDCDFNTLKKNPGQLLLLECLNDKKTTLRGQLEYLPDTNELLFMGSPWFGSIEEVAENKLSLNDFAHHDAMTDLLQLMNSHALANNELKALLQTVKQQQNELTLADQTIKDLALFTTQAPDPILRINYEGDILQKSGIPERRIVYTDCRKN